MISIADKNKVNENITSIEQTSMEKGEATLLTLKQRFERNKQFPAMGNSISQIMQVSNENGGNRKLADIILQDQSLTSKILSVVNSSSYNHFGGEISTISRAVVILGLDQIKSLSLGIMVFEKLNKDPMAEHLKSYACQSFLSAFFAKKLVENIKSINYEEAFLASMFHNLGKQVTLYFFPEKYTDILNLEIKHQLDEDAACIELLGVDFSSIGQFIAIQLKLPKNIILGIQTKPKFIKERPKNAGEYLAQLSALTNEILEAAACGDNDLAEESLINIIERYKVSFALDYEKTLKMLSFLLETLLNYCGVLGINSSENTFCKNFLNFVRMQQETPQQAQA